MKQSSDNHRMSALKQYVGFRYSETGAPDRVPLNMIELATSIYIQNLAAQAPGAHVGARLDHLRPAAAEYRQALNDLFEEINLAGTLQMWVLESLLSPMGVLKCGLTALDGDQGYLHDAGQPFVDPVAWEDWSHDMSVTRLEQCGWMGDRYMLSMDDAAQLYPKHMDRLSAMTHAPQDDMGQPRSRNLSTGDEGQQEHYKDHVELWDLWLPRDNLLVTIQAEGDGSPLRILEADQPERGPYHLLWYTDVPGNTMPLPPVASWMDLHDLTNRIFRKLARQAERQKTLTIVQDAATQDGRRVQDASDGDVIRTSRPEATREARYGGVDNNVLAFIQVLEGKFFVQAGNLEALGGLGPSSGTIGQDELLTESASKRIADMQARVIERTRSLIQHLAWYEWTDPQRERQIVRKLPGSTIEVHSTWSQATREGDFIDYNFDIQPFSMQRQSPQSKLSALAGVFDRFVYPSLPMLQEAGVEIDYEELFKMIGQYSNLPEVERVLKFSDNKQRPEDERQRGDARASASPVTTRNTNTHSSSESTMSGERQKSIQSLMSASESS